MNLKKRSLLTLIALTAGLAFLVLPEAAFATGILLPKDESLPPLAIKSHRVSVNISNQTATTAVDQVFHNSTHRDLEATYIFPLPKGAAINDFALYMNGKRVSGEVLSADKARRTYESIVRRMRDPGLLEYVDGTIFKASIYPVPARGDQRVQLVYSQVVEYDHGLCSYTYPLRTGQRASKTMDDFTVEARIKSGVPIRSVYSPTHEIEIERDGQKRAVVGLEQQRARLDRDFRLLYTVSEEDVGLNLVTFKEPGEDGYFLLMITPRAELDSDEALPKDVLFVFDTSGSMSGDKIVHAKSAARFFIESLNPKDRFNLISFSTTVRPWRESLVSASEENKDAALAKVDRLKASGGTAIHDALLTGMGMLDEAGQKARPRIIVFLTDGLPTVGVTDMNRIIEDVSKANENNGRLFSFGVGANVNVHLLDLVSEKNGGVSEYVQENREMEVKLSNFFSKISEPVMSDLQIEFGGVKTYDLYPTELPDLFAGSQVLVYGRYASAGDTAVALKGNLLGREQRIVHDAGFPKKKTDNDFVPNLWANRKVGYLLDQIRLHGQNRELVDEVVQLGQRYGIVTPYTSYLVVEDNEALMPNAPIFGGDVGASRGGTFLDDLDTNGIPIPDATAQTEAGGGLGRDRAAKSAEEERSRLAAPKPETSGEKAVSTSSAYREKKESTIAESDESADVRYVKGRSFVYAGGAYIDTECKQGDRVIEVPYASDAYFNLLKAKPEFKEFLMLGEMVKISAGNGITIFICQQGDSQRTAEQWKDLLDK